MRKIPYYMKRHYSCPNCGLIVGDMYELGSIRGRGYDCKKCNEHYSEFDFMEYNQEKWDRTADLTNE